MHLRKLFQTKIRKYSQHTAIVVLILFALVQFLLILRHKSPYLSDSYFYKHVYYEMKGDSFEEAREKILRQVDIEEADEISRNFYVNEDSYKNSLSFFTKRPLYPFIAVLISYFIKSEYISFLIPILIAYLGSVIISYFFFKKSLSFQFSIIATAFVVAFYPFLDWSTYFLTDTIGFFFWIIQLIFIYLYLKQRDKKFLFLFIMSLILSLMLREQSVLIIPLLIIMASSTLLVNRFNIYKDKLIQLLSFSTVIVMSYFAVSILLKQKSLLDTIIYTMNNYGLNTNTYTLGEILTYQKDQIIEAHVAFARDLVRHHWWFLLTFLSFIGIFKAIFIKKRISLIGLLLLSSAVASYIAIYLYPVLSYRFFFPVLITVVYFSIKFLEDYASLGVKTNESNRRNRN